MMAYSGGDDICAIVGEIGSHSTKMGFAGEDYPRALFRSDVAVLRSEINDTRTGPIEKVRYDQSVPLHPSTGGDGDWSLSNPIDRSTGLLHLTDPTPQTSSETNSSNNSNTSTSPPIDNPLYKNFLHHAAKSSLYSSDVFSHHPVLLVERSYNPPSHRQKLTEVLFEEFQTPAVFLGRDAVMSCYGCGRTTGVVVDVGARGTNVTPVYDGFVENRGIVRSPMGGNAIDAFMLDIVDTLYKRQCNGNGGGAVSNRKVMPFYQVKSTLTGKPRRGEEFHRLARLDLARTFKESICATANLGYDTVNVDNRYAAMPKAKLELPDGTIVDVGHERYNPAELLFGTNEYFTKIREDHTVNLKKNMTASLSSTAKSNNTSNLSSSSSLGGLLGGGINATTLGEISSNSIQNLVCDSAFKCDRDQQAQLLGNVILSGGGSCLEGMPDRLREEVEAIIHTHTPGWRVKVLAPATVERSVLSWLGGSILGSLGSFHDMWMTKKEYEEFGPCIVNRKCP